MKTKSLALCFAAVLLTACAVHPPFNNRIDYFQLGSLRAMESTINDLRIVWKPEDFTRYVEIKSPSGIIGKASRTRIPTGVAISSRLHEALDQVTTISPSSSNIIYIDVSKAVSNFKFSGTSEGAIDYGEVTLEAKFAYKHQEWVESFYHQEDDPQVAATGASKPLEAAWDSIAIQMATSIITNINRIEKELH